MSRRGARSNMPKSKPLIVLVDMDGVLCDFESHMLSIFRQKYPSEPYVLPENRRTVFMSDQYDELSSGLGDKIKELMESPGFFRTLPEIEGAVDAVKDMSGMDGVEVFLCTTPIQNPINCLPEKYEWVREHFGNDWLGRIMLAKDKTLVVGDVLFDDRPVIKGLVKSPSWRHVLFTQCHNARIPLDKTTAITRLDNWTDGTWRDIIIEHKKRIL